MHVEENNRLQFEMQQLDFRFEVIQPENPEVLPWISPLLESELRSLERVILPYR